MSEPKLTVEESFRKGLEDVIAVGEALGPLCGDKIGELIELSKLALSNDAQCRLLLQAVTRGKR